MKCRVLHIGVQATPRKHQRENWKETRPLQAGARGPAQLPQCRERLTELTEADSVRACGPCRGDMASTGTERRVEADGTLSIVGLPLVGSGHMRLKKRPLPDPTSAFGCSLDGTSPMGQSSRASGWRRMCCVWSILEVRHDDDDDEGKRCGRERDRERRGGLRKHIETTAQTEQRF